jgi:O-antigen/teichoic acid export membrane protein
VSQSRLVARNAIFRGGGEVIAKLASLGFYVVMARELGNEGFGDFMFALSFTSVLVLASGFGLDDLIAREVSREKDRTHGMLSNVVALRCFTAVPLIGVGVLVVVLGDYSTEVVIAFTLVGIGVAIENISHSWYAVLQAFERMEIVSVAVIVQRTLVAAAGIAVLLAGGGLVPTAAVFMAGAVVGQLGVAWALPRFVFRPRVSIDRSKWLGLVKAGIPIGLNVVLFTALLKIDQTLISMLSPDGNAEVGLYAAAMRLIEATNFIPWAFTAAMLPWLSRESGALGLVRGYEIGLKVLAAILLPIGVVFVTLAEPIVELLYGPDFDDAILPLQLLGVTTVLYGFNTFAATVLVARDRPQDFTRVLIAVLVGNVVLNAILIPPHGADGAAVASLASGVVLAALSIRQVTGVIGHVNLEHAFLGPVLAGAAMSAAMVLLPVPAIPAGAVGAVTFAGVLIAWERVRAPEDFAATVRLVTRRTPAEEGT